MSNIMIPAERCEMLITASIEVLGEATRRGDDDFFKTFTDESKCLFASALKRRGKLLVSDISMEEYIPENPERSQLYSFVKVFKDRRNSR